MDAIIIVGSLWGNWRIRLVVEASGLFYVLRVYGDTVSPLCRYQPRLEADEGYQTLS